MAKPQTLKFGMMKVEIGNGATPVVYAAPCGLTQKSFNRGKNLTESVVPDCDDPDSPSEVERDVASTTWSIAGQGILAGEALATWDAAYDSNTSVPLKITMQYASPIGTVVYTGNAHLETYNVDSQQGGRANVSITFQADGGLTRAPALS